MLLHTAAWEIVASHATVACEEEISRHDVSRDIDDHRIVGVTWSVMKVDAVCTNAQRVVFTDEDVDAQRRR